MIALTGCNSTAFFGRGFVLTQLERLQGLNKTVLYFERRLDRRKKRFQGLGETYFRHVADDGEEVESHLGCERNERYKRKHGCAETRQVRCSKTRGPSSGESPIKVHTSKISKMAWKTDCLSALGTFKFSSDVALLSESLPT